MDAGSPLKISSRPPPRRCQAGINAGRPLIGRRAVNQKPQPQHLGDVGLSVENFFICRAVNGPPSPWKRNMELDSRLAAS